MAIEIDEDNLKHGVLGLVMAIVEVVRDALQIQALKRAESGMLSDEEMNRLGDALMELFPYNLRYYALCLIGYRSCFISHYS